MANKSIGSLFIDIAARTGQLETDMAKVKGIIKGVGDESKRMGDSFGQAGNTIESKALKFASALLGAQSIIRVLAESIRSMVKDVEDIPGMPAHLVESIQHVRHALNEAKIDFQIGSAYLIDFVAKFPQALGAVGGYLTAITKDGVDPALARSMAGDYIMGNKGQLTPDQIARDRNPNFDKDVVKAEEQLANAKERTSRATMSQAEQIESLFQSAQKYYNLSAKEDEDKLKRLQNELKAEQFESEANAKYRRLTEQMNANEIKYYKAIEMSDAVHLSKRERVAFFEQKINQLLEERARIYNENASDTISPEDAERLTIVYGKLSEMQNKLNDAKRKEGEMFNELGGAIADNFTQAILKGEKLSDVLKNLANDIQAIILKRIVTEPLANFATGILGSIFGGFFAGGGDPPMGKASIVGEDGPEWFVPKQSGTIIPNGAAFGGGKGNGGDTYIIDARSADRTGLDQLTAMIRQVNGSIEFRAVAAMRNSQGRGV